MAALGQMLFALGVMIALIVFLAFWIKKAQQWQRPQGGQAMKIVSHLSLGVKEKVILISVGDQQILLGVTPNNINHLQTFETPIIEPVATKSVEAPFATILNQYLGKKKVSSPSRQKIEPKSRHQQSVPGKPLDDA